MVGLPKIPDSKEISEMIADAMTPMMADIRAIRKLLEEQNRFLEAKNE